MIGPVGRGVIFGGVRVILILFFAGPGGARVNNFYFDLGKLLVVRHKASQRLEHVIALHHT
jgi:hypothetical protein